jgi:hypothetical protein
MHELRLVAVSEDGSYAVLVVPGRGGRFSLQIDDRLRAVARGQFSRLAQYEIEVESPLRPKEIQERIRAGETAEEIADAAGVPIERVRWFEGPVLAERAYRAEEAQSAMVRRPGESGPGTRLGDVVTERLTALGTSSEDAHWDSIKHNDGTWQVQILFNSGGRAKTAEWLYDPRRKHVTPTDDEAARLCLPEADLPPEPGQPRGATVTPLQPRFGPLSGQGRRPGGRPAELSQPYQPHPQPPAVPEWPAAHRDREPDRAAGYDREPERMPRQGREQERAPAAQYSERTAVRPGEQAAPERHQSEPPAAHYRESESALAPEREPSRGTAREPQHTSRESERVAQPPAQDRATEPASYEHEPQRAATYDREPDQPATHEREPQRAATYDREPDQPATHEREPQRAAAQDRGFDRGPAPEQESAQGSDEREPDQPAAHHAEQPAAPSRPEQPAATRRQPSSPPRKADRNGRGRRAERVSAQQRRPEPEPETAEAEAAAAQAAAQAPAAAAGGSDAPRPAAAQGGRRAAGGRGRRSSVPSWDEIMFGSSRPRD